MTETASAPEPRPGGADHSAARQVWRQYRPELSVVAVVLASLLLAAIVASSGSGDDGAIYLSSPANEREPIEEDLDDFDLRRDRRTPGTLAAMLPPQSAVSVVTVPVPATAPPGGGGPAVGGGGGGPAATTRSTLPRYENGSQMPVVDIVRVGPQNQNAGEPIELRFRAGDGDGFISGWVISWGDGQRTSDAYDPRCGPPPGEPDHEFPAQRHSYREIGTYEIELTVFSRGTCDAGPTQRGTDRASIQIGPPIPDIGL